MNNSFYIKFLIIEIFLVLLLVYVVYSLVKINRSIKNAKRLRKYSLKSINEKNLSLGDEIIELFEKFTIGLIKLLSKSKYFTTSSKKYDKYNFKSDDKDYNLKIIINKIYLSVGFLIIYLITACINRNFNILTSIIIFFIGYYITDIILKIIYNQRRKHIQDDLLKAIIIMNNGFKAGLNINKVIDTVIKDLNGPISEEFKKIRSDIKYGVDLKDAFTRFNERIKTPDSEYISSSLSILNETGGNITSIFSNIEHALTNKKRLSDELKALTSSAKLVYQLLKVIPFILIILIYLLNNEYFKPLYTSPIGYLIIFFIIAIYILYILIVKRILKVEQ